MKVQLLKWRSIETGLYLVAHPHLDVISQGRTPEEALNSFLHTIALEALYRVDEQGNASFPISPPEVSARWARLAAES